MTWEPGNKVVFKLYKELVIRYKEWASPIQNSAHKLPPGATGNVRNGQINKRLTLMVSKSQKLPASVVLFGPRGDE